MNICYFGSYDPNYSRNRNIRKGLIRSNVKVYDCQASGIVFLRYILLLYRFLKIRDKVSAILVGFPGHYDIFFAYLLGKIYDKKVVYDIFASLYETYALDRKIVAKYSNRAKFYHLVDWLGMRFSDLVLVDADAHFTMYEKIYKLAKDKSLTVYIGSDDELFFPVKSVENIDVLYQGSYQPLNGTEYIIRAAKLLPKISFYMIGRGHDRSKSERLAKKLKVSNVTFVDWVNHDQLNYYLNKSKILLGSIGIGDKADSIIPNKLYDAFACKKAIITGNTTAGNEILIHTKNCYLVENGDGRDLAKAIKVLIKNTVLRKEIALGGYNDFKKRFAPQPMVKNLVNYLKTN